MAPFSEEANIRTQLSKNVTWSTEHVEKLKKNNKNKDPPKITTDQDSEIGFEKMEETTKSLAAPMIFFFVLILQLFDKFLTHAKTVIFSPLILYYCKSYSN